MDATLMPQPLIAEVLPGFTTLCIISAAYLSQHPDQFTALLHEKSTAEVIGAGFVTLLASWVVGTVFDTIRDLIEHLLDQWFPVNWQFLFEGPDAKIQKLDESWLAYYFLSGNSAIGFLVSAGCGLFLAPIHIAGAWIAVLVICALLFAVNAAFLRNEIRQMIGFQTCKLPHEGVFARIKPAIPGFSSDRGVGLFAIRYIPKETLVFAPDDDRTVVIKREDVEALTGC